MEYQATTSLIKQQNPYSSSHYIAQWLHGDYSSSYYVALWLHGDYHCDNVVTGPWNNLLHTACLLMHLDTSLHGNNARGAKYAVYYASVATHTVFENIKMAALRAMSEEKCCSPFPCFFIPW